MRWGGEQESAGCEISIVRLCVYTCIVLDTKIVRLCVYTCIVVDTKIVRLCVYTCILLDTKRVHFSTHEKTDFPIVDIFRGICSHKKHAIFL